jgi:hypothetical protein
MHLLDVGCLLLALSNTLCVQGTADPKIKARMRNSVQDYVEVAGLARKLLALWIFPTAAAGSLRLFRTRLLHNAAPGLERTNGVASCGG